MFYLYPASVARGPRTHGFRVPSPTTRRCVGEREREEGGRLEIPHVVAELSRCRSSSHRRPAHATAAPTGSSKSSAPWRPASARSARARSGSVPEFGNILNEYCSSDFLPRQFTSECTPRTPWSCWSAPLPHSLLSSSLGKGEYIYGWYSTSRGRMQSQQERLGFIAISIQFLVCHILLASNY